MIISIVFVGMFLISCSSELPKEITFNKNRLFPEGVDYSYKSNLFYVSSLAEGKIGRVDMKGQYEVFIDDPKLVSAIGLRVDDKRNRLLVCNSDPGVSFKTRKKTQRKLAGLGIYDLSTGKLIRYVNLGRLKKGYHFANDIALDDNGNAYVTDSFSPIIYKVDVAGNASIFLRNRKFKGSGFNLNGIVYHPNGYLIVAKMNSGELYKVPVNNPKSFKKIKSPVKFSGADGLLWADKDQLVVITNQLNTIFLVSTTDDWKSTKVLKNDSRKIWEFPTTGTRVGKNIYVLNAMLNRLFGKSEKPSQNFTIEKVMFQ